jgi:hypothetical protein
VGRRVWSVGRWGGRRRRGCGAWGGWCLSGAALEIGESGESAIAGM